VAIGLDTSVVFRLLIGQPRLQMEVARRRIERAPTSYTWILPVLGKPWGRGRGERQAS